MGLFSSDTKLIGITGYFYVDPNYFNISQYDIGFQTEVRIKKEDMLSIDAAVEIDHFSLPSSISKEDLLILSCVGWCCRILTNSREEEFAKILVENINKINGSTDDFLNGTNHWYYRHEDFEYRITPLNFINTSFIKKSGLTAKKFVYKLSQRKDGIVSANMKTPMAHLPTFYPASLIAVVKAVSEALDKNYRQYLIFYMKTMLMAVIRFNYPSGQGLDSRLINEILEDMRNGHDTAKKAINESDLNLKDKGSKLRSSAAMKQDVKANTVKDKINNSKTEKIREGGDTLSKERISELLEFEEGDVAFIHESKPIIPGIKVDEYVSICKKLNYNKEKVFLELCSRFEGLKSYSSQILEEPELYFSEDDVFDKLDETEREISADILKKLESTTGYVFFFVDGTKLSLGFTNSYLLKLVKDNKSKDDIFLKLVSDYPILKKYDSDILDRLDVEEVPDEESTKENNRKK